MSINVAKRTYLSCVLVSSLTSCLLVAFDAFHFCHCSNRLSTAVLLQDFSWLCWSARACVPNYGDAKNGVLGLQRGPRANVLVSL